MQDDPRCCGTGHCLISAEGRCWCGQQWDGVKMCFPVAAPVADLPAPAAASDAGLSAASASRSTPAAL